MTATPTHDDIASIQKHMRELAAEVQRLKMKNRVSKWQLRLDKQKRKRTDTKTSKSVKRAKRVSLKPPPGRSSIKVKSPKSNAKITIGGKKDKAFRKLISDAKAVGWSRKRLETERVIDVLSQAHNKGITYWDPDYIPQEIQDTAAAQARGKGLAADPGSVDTSDTEGSRFGKGESFRDLFRTYVLDMRPRPNSKVTPYGKGFTEDLLLANKQAENYLRYIRNEDFKSQPFKIYLMYRCIMSRTAMEAPDGEHFREKRAFEISSVNVTETPQRAGSHALPPKGMGGAGMQVIRYPGAIGQALSLCLSGIIAGFNNIKQQGSNWRWDSSVQMTIYASRIVDKVPERGSAASVEARMLESVAAPESDAMQTAGSYLPNPNWIKSRGLSQYIFNPRPYTHRVEHDNLCFSWCILRAQHPNGVRKSLDSVEVYEGLERTSKRYSKKKDGAAGDHSLYYTFGNVADLAEGIALGYIQHIRLPDGVEYPVPLKTEVFEAIEALNGFSFSIFKIGPKELTPFYCSRTQSPDKPHYRLGVMQSTIPIKTGQSVFGVIDPDHFNFHFVLIKDLVGIEGPVKNKHGDPNPDTLICDNCMSRFNANSKKYTYYDHIRSCIYNEPTKLKLPKMDENVLRFDKFKYTQIQPFVIYADLEAINQPRDGESQISDSLEILSDHVVCSWAYQIVVAPPYKHLFDNRPGVDGRPFKEIRSFAGKGAMESFFCHLRQDTDVMHAIVTGIDGDAPFAFDPDSPEMVRTLNTTKDCYFCGRPLPPAGAKDIEIDHRRVFHHDHFTGEFIGIAHSLCNIGASIKKNYMVDIFFHNLGGYDIFHILQAIGEMQEGWSDIIQQEPTREDPSGIRDAEIEVLAKSLERFTTLTWKGRAVFKDTLQFVQAPLDTLVRNLANSLTTPEDKHKAFYLIRDWHRFRPDGTEADFERLLKKGVYPYTFAKSIDDLWNTRSLPPKEAYSTELRGDITDGEYRRAEFFWRYTSCGSMMDNTVYYNELDVLLLASVFEVFRLGCQKPFPDGYGLDPVHMVTAPSLSYNAMLLFNLRRGVEVETFCETPDGSGTVMFDMTEKGIRGGMCQVIRPYAKSQPLPEGEGARWDDDVHAFEAKLSGETRVIYVDANNLYGGAMSEPMPLGDYKLIKKGREHNLSPAEYRRRLEEMEKLFDVSAVDDSVLGLTQDYVVMLERDLKWLNPNLAEVNEFVSKELADDDPVAYLVDVDIHIPEELHDYFNDLPPFPENKLPPDPSPFTRKQFAQFGDKATAFKFNKLILDLHDKKDYVIHSRLLQFFVRLGCVITSVNRVISFMQSRWLQAYINFNNELRKKAKDEVEKALRKLMNNAIFGKMMEDVRSHRDISFILPSQWSKAVKMSSGPHMRHFRIIVPDKMLLIERAKSSVRANRPIAVGQAILDISKLIMYKHHYQSIVPFFCTPGIENMVCRALLCYLDTDSLIYLIYGIKGKTIATELRELHMATDLFDLSEIQDPQNNPITAGMSAEDINRNAKVLCKLKDETKGVIISEAFFLRSKMYSILLAAEIIEKHHNKKKAAMGKKKKLHHIAKKKGIPKKLPSDQGNLLFGHEAYKDIYYGAQGGKVTFPTINHTKKLALYTAVQTKAGLSNLEDKNHWFNAAVCLRYGHRLIRKWEKKLSLGGMRRADIEVEMQLIRDWEEDAKQSILLLEAQARAHMDYAREEREMFLQECAMLPDESVSSFVSMEDESGDEPVFDLSDPSLVAFMETSI